MLFSRLDSIYRECCIYRRYIIFCKILCV